RPGAGQFPARLRPGPGSRGLPADRRADGQPDGQNGDDHRATSFAAGAAHVSMLGVISQVKRPEGPLRLAPLRVMLIITRSPWTVGAGWGAWFSAGLAGSDRWPSSMSGDGMVAAPATSSHRDLDWAFTLGRASRAMARSWLRRSGEGGG